MDVRLGPRFSKAVPFRATIFCDYDPKLLSGASPKFACQVDDGELKVKYGGTNAEVYAEVAASRLLWALGFGADGMYPVRVVCRGCPRELGGMLRAVGTSGAARESVPELIFDPAVIERKAPGREFPGDEGWSWRELDHVSPTAGGAPRAHVDAMKLLAVFIQHTDNKPVQQRLLCRGDSDDDDDADDADVAAAECERPFLMMQDVGLTFGRANWLNANDKAMNLVEWSATPVWREGPGCVGNLPRSITGTLENPVISEEGRRFLADLLTQLTDEQIHALFEVSRVHLRLRDPSKARSGFATAGEWASAFKEKRRQIVERRCA
jgi:hypothetical protein